MPDGSEPALLRRRRPLAEPAVSPPARGKRVALVISHLGPGGAQRVVANAVDALLARGVDLHLLVLTGGAEAYRIDPKISRHVHRRGALGPVGVLAWLRRTLRSLAPDSVLSLITETNILAVLASRGLRTHLVISERNDPRLQRHRRHVEVLRRIVYRHANVVTANSEGALTTLEAFVPREKLAFLPNPLLATADGERARLRGPTVVTVGRLVPQKGLDALLRAWAKAAPALPGWDLAILGDGPLSGELKAMATALGVGASVDFLGHVPDPFPILRSADLFVLTSRFEGTPNALLEAMVCGLPAIVSDASPGPRELIGSGENPAGLVVAVENADAAAEAIVRLATDEGLRRRFGRAAQERVAPYAADRAIETWLRLLNCG
jgi:glycosyltransferase involved in cell wall biosynthesis